MREKIRAEREEDESTAGLLPVGAGPRAFPVFVGSLAADQLALSALDVGK